ncbi:MAG TPA: hypothetical protein VMU66_00980 [Gaiellales bacterium]|nr:hypothetical protein [Gaiellales bacterium]
MSAAGPVRLVYVAGAGRSGTTLLAMLLGALPGATALGEVRHLWARGIRDNQLCGCGEPFHECPFWQEVGDLAFGGWDRVDVDRILALQRAVDRFRSVPRQALGGIGGGREAMVDEYLSAFRPIYRAAARIGGGVLVDSSKAPSFLALLRRQPGIDLRVVHLVRDSRAVVYSWSRRRLRPELRGAGPGYMAMIGARRSTADWVANNLAIDLIGAGRGTVERVRYEALMRDPERELRRLVGDWLASPGDGGGEDSPARIAIGTQHTVAGNPIRFQQGGITLRSDDEWMTAMPLQRRLAVAAATWPLLLRYGYVLRSGRS